LQGRHGIFDAGQGNPNTGRALDQGHHASCAKAASTIARHGVKFSIQPERRGTGEDPDFPGLQGAEKVEATEKIMSARLAKSGDSKARARRKTAAENLARDEANGGQVPFQYASDYKVLGRSWKRNRKRARTSYGAVVVERRWEDGSGNTFTPAYATAEEDRAKGV